MVRGTSQPSDTSKSFEIHSITVGTPEKESPARESDPNGRREGLPDDEQDVASNMAQEVWDSLKEEFYEQVEQLPLSLHRSFALIGEQDKEVEACRSELLPTIRSYVKLRQSLQPSLPQHLSVQDSLEGDPPAPLSGSSGSGLDYAESSSGAAALRPEQSADTSSRRELQLEGHRATIHAQYKEEDVDVSMRDISSQSSPHASVSSPAMRTTVTVPETPGSLRGDQQSQPTPTRIHGIRETDASVPKSVPFPPRPKPKTTRELLTRIAFLMGEVIRASEEKVGLATAAYDSVDRHVRVLDTVIKGHEADIAPGLSEEARLVGMIGPDAIGSMTNPLADDDDEEPQLGITGPGGQSGAESTSFRRAKKGDRKDKREHVPAENVVSRVNAFPPRANREVPTDEPRYCYCNQFSYGEMIACDSPDCSREWFHLGCVGLTAPPKDNVKWYCRECEELRRSRRKRIR